METPNRVDLLFRARVALASVLDLLFSTGEDTETEDEDVETLISAVDPLYKLSERENDG